MTTKGNRHAAFAEEYARRMLTEKEPWRKLQVELENGWVSMNTHPSWMEEVDYRWAPPKTITLAGVEFPEPLREAPEPGTDYWVVPRTEKPVRLPWGGSDAELTWLRLGILQATKEGAIAQFRAMILSVGGDPG